MKLSTIIFFSLLCFHLSSQVRINPAYCIVTNGKEFRNGSYYMPDLSKTDSIFIKETSTDRICQLTWCRWKFVTESETFIIKDMEQVPNYILLLKPKDKIVMEKIVLLPDCFAPPEEIVIGFL